MAETLEQLDVKYVESEKSSLVSSKKMKELTTTLQVRKNKQELTNFRPNLWVTLRSEIIRWSTYDVNFFKSKELFAAVWRKSARQQAAKKSAKLYGTGSLQKVTGALRLLIWRIIHPPPPSPIPTGKCTVSTDNDFYTVFSLIWNVKQFLRFIINKCTEDRHIRAGSRIWA